MKTANLSILLVDSYIQWLRGLVDGLDPKLDILFDVLANTDYRFVMKDDINRALDGKVLRRRFEREAMPGFHIVGDCSFLEFLIGLAKRLDESMYDHKNPNQLGRWFWVLLSNIGIDPEAVEAYSVIGVTEIESAIERVLSRDYATNGEFGGLFPLDKFNGDVTTLSIWDQLQLYLMEFPLKWEY